MTSAFQHLKRRDFLALCGATTVSSLLIACESGTTQALTPTATQAAATATSTPTPKPTQPPKLTDGDWTALGKSLQGSLVRPNNAQYGTALQLFDPRFDGIKPAGIAYCASPGDVQKSLYFVKRFAIPLAPRAGGHSYAGYSTTKGLVIDVTRMNKVSVNTKAGTATVGAGARLIDVYATLAQYNQVIPAGSCATVGVAGLTMGGGHGVLGRKFGLTCDNLLSAQVVLADGRVVNTDAKQNADLFWALRGGGGGNFGIATSFTFRTHAASTLSIFTLNFPWSSAVAVFNAWQNWAPKAPDELWSNCLLLPTSNKSGDPLIRVNGVYVGPTGPLNNMLQQLINKIGVGPTARFVESHNVLDTMQIEAGCYGESVAACHLPSQNPQGTLQRVMTLSKSDYYTHALPTQAIQLLVNAIQARQRSSNLIGGGIAFDAYGGAINRVAANATAFVHRNALFSTQYSADLKPGDSQSVVMANKKWLNDTWQSLRKYASGEAYQNYIDPDLKNWQQAYYGSNLARLRTVKKTYDPTNLFRFAQSIPPA